MPWLTPNNTSPRLIVYNGYIHPPWEYSGGMQGESLHEMHVYDRISIEELREEDIDLEELGDFWNQNCIRFHLGLVERNKVAVVNFYFGGNPGDQQTVQIFVGKRLFIKILCQSQYVSERYRTGPQDYTRVVGSLAIEGDGITPIEIFLRPTFRDVHRGTVPFYFYGVEWEVIE